MRDAKQGGLPPPTSGTGKQVPPLVAIQPAERLIKDHKPRIRPEHDPDKWAGFAARGAILA